MIEKNIIENFFQKWKLKLNVKKDIVWTDNFELWERVKFKSKSICLPFGAVKIDKKPTVFINVKRHGNDSKNMENTVVHELLHIKHPNLSESKIRKRATKLIPIK